MDIQKATWVTLTGKTRHGKNRINQHGNPWLVVSTGRFQGQPAMQLRSFDQTEGPKHNKGFDGRWVLINNDPNFNWRQNENNQ